MQQQDYPGSRVFPLGSAWRARDTAANRAQNIPPGAGFRLVHGCATFFSLYSESLNVPNFKVPRSLFGQNFTHDMFRPNLTAGFPHKHYTNDFKANAARNGR